jgi:hypothetical protein
LNLGFLNWTFEVVLFTLYGLSVELNLGFIGIWFFIVVWRFEFGLFTIFGLSVYSILAFYCSLAF